MVRDASSADAPLMSTAAYQPEPITRDGYERLSAELEQLLAVKRRQLADDLPEAVEHRIEELQTALGYARIVDPPVDDIACIGQRLSIRLAPGATPLEYHLVGPIEADAAARRISIDSPIGQALMGHGAGDEVEVETPGGVRVVEIVAVGRLPASDAR